MHGRGRLRMKEESDLDLFPTYIYLSGVRVWLWLNLTLLKTYESAHQRIKSIFPPHVDTGHINPRVSDKPPASNILLEKGEGSFLGSKNSIILRFSLYILLHRGIVWCAGSFLIPPLNFVDTEP